MSEQSPPPWEADPFSQFFADAQFNERVTAIHLEPAFRILEQVNEVFRDLGEIVHHNSASLLVPGFLAIRTHSSFLAGLRLAMGGQVVEAFPVLRSAVEQAWYALHIAKDKNVDSRAEIWLRRNDGPKEKDRCKGTFTIKAVKETHKLQDQEGAKNLSQVYETLIDWGAHPNPYGVLTSLTRNEDERAVNFGVGILMPNPKVTGFALRMAAATGLGCLRVFELIYPERFKILALDTKLSRLAADATAYFLAYGEELEG